MNSEHSRKQVQAHVANMKCKITDVIYTAVIVIMIVIVIVILGSRSMGDIVP
jgi:hypothetical protein